MNWKLLGVLFFTIFISMLGLGMVVPLLPVYAHELGASSKDIGYIFASFSLSLAIFSPIIGRLSDVKGRKLFIVSGMLVYGVSSAELVFSESIASLILIRFIQGIAASLVAAAEAYAGDITPKGKEGLVMGLVNASYAAGLCGGPLTGGVAKDIFGIRASFAAMGVVCLIGLLACAIWLPSEPKASADRVMIPACYRELLKNRAMSGLLVFRFVYAACISAIWAFTPLIAETRYGMSGLSIGVVIMLGVFISAVLMPPAGVLSDRVSKRLLMALGGVVLVYGMNVFAQVRMERDFYMVGVLIGVGNGVSMPAVTGMSVVMGREHRSMGSVISFLIMGETLGMAAGSVLAGNLMDTVGVTAAFGGMGAIMLVATIAALLLTSDAANV